MQEGLFADEIAVDQADVVYTPDHVARRIVEEFRPTGRILEPCKGNGAFLRNLPSAEWCEIAEGRDFFAFSGTVDWLVSNPPYSIWDRWMEHSIKVAPNILYLVPIVKVFRGDAIKSVYEWGGIRKMLVFPSGRAIGFPFGFACGAFHFERSYKGPMDVKIA